MAVPHFDRTGTNDMSRSDHAEQVLLETENETPGAIAFGIDNNAAFVVTGDSAMVVSGDGEATCHVVVADEETGETSTAPLVPQVTISSPYHRHFEPEINDPQLVSAMSE